MCLGCAFVWGNVCFFRFFRKVVQLFVQTISRIVIKALFFFPQTSAIPVTVPHSSPSKPKWPSRQPMLCHPRWVPHPPSWAWQESRAVHRVLPKLLCQVWLWNTQDSWGTETSMLGSHLRCHPGISCVSTGLQGKMVLSNPGILFLITWEQKILGSLTPLPSSAPLISPSCWIVCALTLSTGFRSSIQTPGQLKQGRNIIRCCQRASRLQGLMEPAKPRTERGQAAAGWCQRDSRLTISFQNQ